MSALAILAGAITLCSAPHPSNPCQVDTRMTPNIAAIRALAIDTTTPEPVKIALDVEARLSMAYPPCGTSEAAKAVACIKWTVVPCPTTHNRWGGILPPIGCDPAVFVSIIPGATK